MKFYNFLNQPFSKEESVKIQLLEHQIQDEQLHFSNLSEENLNNGLSQLTFMRKKFSNSLQKGESQNWSSANFFIESQIQSGKFPNWAHIQQINSLLTNSAGEVRNQEIYLGRLMACPHTELDYTLNYFIENILPSQNYSPLVHSALCHYWLLSIHPFNDGNGRTSTLLADWILSYHNFLPQSFNTKIDAILMYLPDRETKMTSGMSVIKILSNVLRSYSLFKI